MAIGQSVPMVDARERVLGQIGYVLNLELPGMLVGRILRSPLPHARLVHIDASRAEKLPGVRAVLTRADVPEDGPLYPYFGPVFRDQGVVAMDKVRFVGDPVAAVAAVNEDAAQAALDLIQVEYDELPPVTDPLQALEPGAPLVHEGPPRLLGPGFADIVINTSAEPSNICNHFKLRKGDVDRGFRQADEVFEDVFTCPAVQHVALEPHVAAASVEANKITVWSGTQTPYVVRAQLADIFRFPQSRVRLVVHTLGGGFGGKCYPKLEPLAAVLAWKAHQSVKIVLRRDEDFLTLTKHAVVIRMKTGVKRDGTLLARQTECYFNTGAYADIGPRLIKNGGYATAGPYHIPNVKVDSYAVYTNSVPAGAFRGYGVSQAAWAYESQMDMIAERLGLDPLVFRLKNMLREGDRFATGEVVGDMHYAELLQREAQWIGWSPECARWLRDGTAAQDGAGPVRRGKGLAMVIKGTVTPSTSTASVKLNEDGSLNVLTSSVEMGQGAKTAVAQIAADAADLSYECVLVSEPDTDVTPYDQQTSSSRTTFSMGTAVRYASADVKRQVVQLAASLLEVSTEDLETVDGRVQVRGVPERSMSYGEVVRKARKGNLLGHGVFVTEGGLDPETGQGVASVHWHQAAASCEVAVDVETGRVAIERFHGGVFAGRMVNPRQCELQVEGSSIFGFGQALFEETKYDGAHLVNRNLSDYMIPSALDIPDDFQVSVLENLNSDEMHGIGETSLPPVMAAVANAVYNAVGVRIADLPLTPEKVLRALGERQ